MSFYGNVTNVNNTTFTFDRIYRSRLEMDREAQTDGVFIGRYVLVDYDNDGQSYFSRVYLKTENSSSKFYFSSNYDETTRVKFTDTLGESINTTVVKDEIVYALNDGSKQQTFYQCIGSDGQGYANFAEILEPDIPQDNYLYHYLQDKNHYGETYDSVVWQKIYSDSKEKYSKIAELNSVVPSFGLVVDQPTMTPVQPHFDADSTNVSYKLHLQPQWGFKVAHAELQNNSEREVEYPISDATASYSKGIYDINTGLTVQEADNDYAAAIYFNKAGFKSEKEIKSNQAESSNYIGIKTTWKSGAKYNTHNKIDPTETAEKVDTLELEINLPALGDAVSEMWDIVYGFGDSANDNKRNKDIKWDSTDGLRLVTDDETVYNTANVETVAGCINSIHDLMGMIIVDASKSDAVIEAGESADGYDKNKIYYKGNKFFIKDKQYNYTKSNAPEINKVTFSSFNNFFEKMANDDYELAESYVHGNQYYQLNSSTIEIDGIYEPNHYYYIDNNNYILATESAYVENRRYYNITEGERKSNKNYFVAKSHESFIENGKEYYRGLFIRTGNQNDGYGYTAVGEGATYNSSANYVYVDKYILEKESTTGGQVVDIYEIYGNVEVLNLEEFTNRTVIYYRQGNNYIKETKENMPYYSTPKNYITIASIEEPVLYDGYNTLYQINTNDKNVIVEYKKVEDNDHWDSNKTYGVIQTLTTVPNNSTYFYEPGKYYYYPSNDNTKSLILDYSKSAQSGIDYYFQDLLYVMEDYEGIYSKGQLWNLAVTKPTNLKLGRRTEKWVWKELDGFARTFNTIHGLIIEIRNILKTGDYLTRDQQTVQGCINQINDIIRKINELKPGYFIMVDETGRMTSGLPQGDHWIDVVYESGAMIKHKFTAAENGDTESDFNVNGSGVDTINLYTPTVDDAGHVIGKNTETVTLPYGYKTISSVASTDSTDSIAGESKLPGISAVNTQDTVSIDPGNVWVDIRLQKPNIVKIAHAVNAIKTTGMIEQSDLNSDSFPINTLEIPDWSYDKAGHITSKLSHEYILPYGYKTIKASYPPQNQDWNLNPNITSNTSAINTQDVLNINADEWISIDAIKDNGVSKLNFAHRSPVPPTTEIRTIDKAPKFGESFSMPVYIYDSKGHISRELSIGVTVPKGSLDDKAKTESDIITQLSFDDESGALSTTRENLSSIKLNGYSRDAENNNDIAATDTLGVALSKLQTQIIEEESARKTAINNLDSTITSDKSEVITSITQVDGKITNAGKARVGELYLTGWTIGDNTADNTPIADTDTVFKAFGKAQRQINAHKNAIDLLNGSSSAVGSVAYQIASAVPAEKIAKWDAAEANVQSDWNVTDETSDAFIKNKPTLDNFITLETYNTLLERIARLEARIQALENPIPGEVTG